MGLSTDRSRPEDAVGVGVRGDLLSVRQSYKEEASPVGVTAQGSYVTEPMRDGTQLVIRVVRLRLVPRGFTPTRGFLRNEVGPL